MRNYTVGGGVCPLKSISKALRILDIFLSYEGSQVGLSEIAKISGLDNATVSRILATYVQNGYLTQAKKRGKYSLGPKLFNTSFINRQRDSLIEITKPFLVELNTRYGEAIRLATINGILMSSEEIYPSTQPWKIIMERSFQPLYCTAMGKIFLASMAKQDLKKYLVSVPLQRLTDNTITNAHELRTQLTHIAREGISYNDEEQFVGIRGVAAPIRDMRGTVIAAFSVVGPSSRLSRAQLSEIAPDIKVCSRNISRHLGFEGKR
jgi:IclR family transcriptional regulator, KDG regulon repressor